MKKTIMGSGMVFSPDQKYEIINPPYKELTEMFNAMSELYKNANDKTVIDNMIKMINIPVLFLNKDNLKKE